jgi:polyhydroxyalkanoate synthesis regulator phasin
LEEASNNNEDLTNKLKEIPLLQETLKELKTALQAQKSETEAKIAKVDALEKKLQEVEDEADFFRKKLLEAETYINHI